jgi:hypothetical protein
MLLVILLKLLFTGCIPWNHVVMLSLDRKKSFNTTTLSDYKTEIKTLVSSLAKFYLHFKNTPAAEKILLEDSDVENVKFIFSTIGYGQCLSGFPFKHCCAREKEKKDSLFCSYHSEIFDSDKEQSEFDNKAMFEFAEKCVSNTLYYKVAHKIQLSIEVPFADWINFYFSEKYQKKGTEYASLIFHH